MKTTHMKPVEGGSTKPTIKNRISTKLPDGLVRHLEKRHGRFSDMKAIFHCVEVFTNVWVGVAGDGDNGCYEYFQFVPHGDPKMDFFTLTEIGYGDAARALRDALNAAGL